MGNTQGKIDLSGSHLPVLSKMLNVTDGAVLELGAGFNSTPLLYWTCKASKRPFRSYENDKAWCEKMGDFTTYIDDWDKVNYLEFYWSLVFIDQRPALRRHKDAIRLKDNAQFVILHDAEPEIDKFYAYRRVYPHYRFKHHFDRVKPHTVILSNTVHPQQYFQY